MSDSDFDPRSFRNALGTYATGVTVITTRDEDGAPVGMTASSFNSLSLDPPLLLWSIDKNTGVFDAFNACDHFTIHVLHTDQEDMSNHFAGRGFDKFKDIECTAGIGGSPKLADFLSCFECETWARYEGGDHIILVGEVKRYEVQDGAPLLFAGGRYAEIAKEAAQKE